MENHKDPIEILMKEHDEGIKYLARLDNAADSIRQNGFSAEAFEQIAEAIRFVDVDIRQHNEKEEKYLFPLMDRHVNGPAKVMRSEHRELWRVFSELRKSVKDVEEGRIHGTSIKELLQSSKLLVELLSQHIAKENEVLFPMAKQVLSSEEYEQLKEEINNATVTQAK